MLFILPNNPGDVVMALQTVGRLKAERPDLRCDYLVSDECRSLVEGSPLIRRVHIIPKQLLKAKWNAGEVTQAVALVEKFLKELSATHYDLSLNLFQEKFGGVIQSFVNADQKVGLELIEGRHYRIESRYLEHLAAVPAARRDNGWHAVDVYIRAARRALGLSGPGARHDNQQQPSSYYRPRRSTPVLPTLPKPVQAQKLTPGGYLVFHPGAAWAGKRWPENNWAELANLAHRAGLTLAFTGAPEERSGMERILARMQPEARNAAVDCVGKTTLLEAAWILVNARLVVTGDTVAMHLAAAAGTPTLVLFGPSNPVETGPYGQGHIVLQTDPNPLPDLAFQSDHEGLHRLRPEVVAAYLLEGKLPEDVLVWQTDWDQDMDMQILRDAKQKIHKSHIRAKALMRALDREEGKPLGRSETLTGNRKSFQEALANAIAHPNPTALGLLATEEQSLAGETRDNLVWEAYRIAVNGLSLQDLPMHLALRKSRFEKALYEERQTVFTRTN